MARAESITFQEFRTRFSTEDACRTELFRLRFPEGFVCPKCGCTEYYPVRGRNTFQCRACRHQTSVTAGTVIKHGRSSVLRRKRQRKGSWRKPCRRSLRSVCCSAQSRKYPDCLERAQKGGRHGRWLCIGRKNREQFRRISPRKKSIGRDNVRRRLHRSSRRPCYSISCSRSAKRFEAKNS